MAVARFFAKYFRRGESGNFDADFFDKYATKSYYLSRGAAGNVYGPIRRKKTLLAIKQSTFADGKVTDQFKKDIESKKDTWTSLQHRHLMRIYSVYLDQLPNVMFIVMEFAAGGSLHRTLRSLGTTNKILPVEVVTNSAKQIAEGMLYLQEKNIIHRDLKSSNILLMETFDDSNPQKMITLKIADFDEIKEHDHTTTMSFVGTFAYMAPEVLQNQWYSKGSDVWSYGVVVWEMLSGDIPHKGVDPHSLMQKSINGLLNKLPMQQSFPDEFQLLLRNCWNPEHKERPSFQDILCFQDPENEVTEDEIELRHKMKADPDENKFSAVAILNEYLFVALPKCSYLSVYNCNDFQGLELLIVEGLVSTIDMCSCNINTCLYILDYKGQSSTDDILRINSDGEVLKSWQTKSGHHLSAGIDGNVIITLRCEQSLLEYSPNGDCLREIRLPCCSGPQHAIKVSNCRYIVSHHDLLKSVDRLCLVDVAGNVEKSFGRETGSAKDQLNAPCHFAVGNSGYLIVADFYNHRLLLLDSNLEFKTKIVSKYKQRFLQPHKICLSETLLVVLIEGGDPYNSTSTEADRTETEEGDTSTKNNEMLIEEDCNLLVFNIEPLLQKYFG